MQAPLSIALNHVDLGLSDASQPTHARHRPRPDAMLRVVALLLAAAPIAASGPLDDYINAPEPAFAWRDTAARVKLPPCPNVWLGKGPPGPLLTS